MRSVRSSALLLGALLALLPACDGDDQLATLRWYINPDNGGQVELAARCTAAAQGAYRIEVSLLPNDATGQREQLVRRLAARDRSIDLMSLDPPFVAELAAAGFLRPYTETEAAELGEEVLAGPLAATMWRDTMFAAPFWANTQLLWYRKSVARRAGLDPSKPLTWDAIVAAASATGTTVAVQGHRYEGYMVWINALVASAGGAILTDPDAGKEAVPGLDSAAGRRAAAIIGGLARSPAADASIATADEEAARRTFQGERGGFMVNWPYVYGAADEAATSGALPRAVLDDIGWARYPRVDADKPSRPPLGGIALGISAFSRHQAQAAHAVRCITSAESQRRYMLGAKLPAARSSVYQDPAVRRGFPMADLIRESIDQASPRPPTPYYSDVSAAVVRIFHPPAEVDATAPSAAARLIVDVLHDRVLL